jgi:DNA ligase-4
MSRSKRAKSPDVDAIEEDEKQYGSGPLSLRELDELYETDTLSHP